MLIDGNQIAIDGPSASGKSTVARLVAERMNAYYINTGEMYRTLTWLVRTRGIDPSASPEAVAALLGEIDIRYSLSGDALTLTCNGQVVDLVEVRKPEVTAIVSQVAKIPEVRTWMVERQKQSAELGLVVAEGRDIGTVVFPNAKWKFFVTASPEERARRRLAQDGETPDGATLQEVARQIAERDHMDSTRKVSPLKQAEDAVLVDTTGMTIDEVLDFVTGRIK